jgi:hypothetical protein
MKYWNNKKTRWGNKLTGNEKITLIDGSFDDWGRILSIKEKDGKIRFREECDSYFSLEVSKEQAIEILKEAIDWIKENK